MNEQHFAYKSGSTNRGLHDLRPGQHRSPRSRQTKRPESPKQTVSQSVLATAGGFAHHYFDNLHFKQAFAAPLLLLGVVF